MANQLSKDYLKDVWAKLGAFIKPRTLLCYLLPAKCLLFIKASINIVRKMDYQKRDVLLDISSYYELNARRYPYKNEPETVDWIETFIKEGDVFYDIGANIGAYSLIAAKFLNGKVRVFAFEPVFSTYAQLCKNIFLNKSQGSIVPLLIPLSDQTKMDTFNYTNLMSGASLHAVGDPISHLGKIFTPLVAQQVIAYRMDDLIKQFKLPVPNYIKMDVDGIEYSILQGAVETLKNPAVKSIILEIERDEEEMKITELLKSKGFISHSKGEINHIFIRE